MITLHSPEPLVMDVTLHAELSASTVASLAAAAPDDPVVWELANCRIHATAEVVKAWLTLGQMNRDDAVS